MLKILLGSVIRLKGCVKSGFCRRGSLVTNCLQFPKHSINWGICLNFGCFVDRMLGNLEYYIIALIFSGLALFLLESLRDLGKWPLSLTGLWNTFDKITMLVKKEKNYHIVRVCKVDGSLQSSKDVVRNPLKGVW